MQNAEMKLGEEAVDISGLEMSFDLETMLGLYYLY